jgi:hypothetical protein
MTDKALKAKIVAKIDEGEFTYADLPDFLTLFCQIANDSDDVQDEASGVNLRYQIILAGGEPFWLEISSGDFSWGKGACDEPTNTLRATANDAAMIFIGEKDATGAYQSGALKVEGALPNAVKLRTFIEIVREEIDG